MVCCYTDLICDIVHYNDTMSTSVVAGCDCTKPLLTGRIPLSKEKEHLMTGFVLTLIKIKATHLIQLLMVNTNAITNKHFHQY